ncbi:MAG: hypothetical protein QM660_08885 [Dysgonomonas sp.]
MRKLLPILLLAVLFISCSSDDDNEDPNNGNQNGKDMIDEKILGKWKVEYSKTIKPAIYNETTGKVEYDEKEAKITVYEGNFGEPNVVPICGLFDTNEYNIEIKSDNSITVTRANNNPTKSISYKIEDNNLKWQSGVNNPTGVVRYSLKNNLLTMELIKAEGAQLTYYTISEYSKITE